MFNNQNDTCDICTLTTGSGAFISSICTFVEEQFFYRFLLFQCRWVGVSVFVGWLVGLYVINGINLYFMMILTPFNTTTTTCNIRCCPVNIYKHMNEHQPILVRCRYLRFVVAGYVVELSFIKNCVFTLSSMLILSTSVSGFHVSVISSILSLM